MEEIYTDPPGMPGDERMAAAELRVVREHLGLTIEWLCADLDVQGRTGRRWESGESPIPDGVRLRIEEIEQQTAVLVGEAVAACQDARDPVLLTYRSDAEYRMHHPELTWPASWHRALVARVAQEVSGLAIDYWTPSGRSAG